MRRLAVLFVMGTVLVWACQFDGSLREYLNVVFWSPFAKRAVDFERPNVKRMDTAYAGMGPVSATPLGKLREQYQKLAAPQESGFDVAPFHAAVATARADSTLGARDREEEELIDAKIDMRAGTTETPDRFRAAQAKYEAFLKTATTPEWVSEALGWLAYTHLQLKERTAAVKIYLDELNRDGSNLSRETLLNSIQIAYSRDDLAKHIDEYFDKPEYAAFAVQLATNPSSEWPDLYRRVRQLLEDHPKLFRSEDFALLSMRTAMRMGDPAGALRLASMVPSNSALRRNPDYLWISAGAQFVTRNYARAEAPLLRLYRSLPDDDARKAAAAYGLCGVYQKLGNPVEQLRYALWLYGQARRRGYYSGDPSYANLELYWAFSGFDLNLLLDAEAPQSAIEEFLAKYPKAPDIRVVKYALAVRLTRADRYEEAAQIYNEIGQKRRGPRMRELAKLWADKTPEGKYRFAEFLSSNTNGVYFNDLLWSGFQGYALTADTDTRFTKAERAIAVPRERKLRDDQEEYWRAYHVLREVMDEEGHSELGIKAAKLAQRDLRRISVRFGREKEIAQGDIEIERWLARLK